jgi:hypothetical protein
VLSTSSLLLTDTLKSSDGGDQEKERETEVQRGSLLKILDQATSLSLTTNDLTNQERGQLLDVLFWASDLLSDGRR